MVVQSNKRTMQQHQIIVFYLISYISPRNEIAYDNKDAQNRNDFDRVFDVNFWRSFSPITSFDHKGENRTTRLICPAWLDNVLRNTDLRRTKCPA